MNEVTKNGTKISLSPSFRLNPPNDRFIFLRSVNGTHHEIKQGKGTRKIFVVVFGIDAVMNLVHRGATKDVLQKTK